MTGENLAKAGLAFRRADRSLPGLGTTMRLRGGAIVKGELVRVDVTSGDALTNTNYKVIDLGTETTASSPLATVVKVTAASEGDIIGVALESASDDALVRVEFAQGGMPVIVEALAGDTVTVGLQLVAATDARLDPAGTPVGKVLAIALEGGSDGSLIDVLFFGNAGNGFHQT
jgi:hypothetical protein